jgi:hypothetical protein
MAARSNREEKSDYHGGAGDLPGRVERKAHGGVETPWCEGLAGIMTRCHKEKGILIPGCMGVAAACGCGMSDYDIMSFCTCPPINEKKEKDRIERRLARLEREVEVYKKRDEIWRNKYAIIQDDLARAFETIEKLEGRIVIDEPMLER